MTGTLHGSTINATNLQEATVNLSSKYLQSSGGTMTGKLAFTNVAAKDRLTLWYHSSSYYAIGVFNGELQYTTVTSHTFYTNAT